LANIFENKDRRVIPNWRSFRKTANLGELDNIKKQSSKSNYVNNSIDDYIEAWKENKTIPHAGDLISAAVSNGITDNTFVIDAANFIIANPILTTKPQQSLAGRILFKIEPTNLLKRLENLSLDDFDVFEKQELIRKKIKNIKFEIIQFPYNSILYVELSRNYSILGQSKKAKNAMKVALQLSPENRFILRSAVRLFIHSDELEFAHDLVRKNAMTNFDPWLTSTEIALATLRKRTSRFMKKGLEMVDSQNFSPFSFTELASSLGTVELLTGNSKKSRKLFQSALIAPNDNSLAQVEWASSKDPLLNINPTAFKINYNYEAMALDYYHNNQQEEAFENTFRWFLDMPFSKRPVMFGSHIANTFLNDQEKSRAFLKAGLISHPNDPQIINNLVYSLALENNTKEAFEHLKNINTEGIDKSTQICLKATRGLVYFRSGIPDLGRRNYLEAIEEAKGVKNHYFNWLAILNYTREEILIKSEFVEPLMHVIGQIPDDSVDLDINKLKNEVIELHDKMKQQAK
jgi:tetratricopeptide (TPR) repeat protein